MTRPLLLASAFAALFLAACDWFPVCTATRCGPGCEDTRCVDEDGGTDDGGDTDGGDRDGGHSDGGRSDGGGGSDGGGDGGGECVPTAEDCTDGIDNDCDDQVDCEDADCAEKLCRDAAGECDVAEYCSGTTCPADAFLPGGWRELPALSSGRLRFAGAVIGDRVFVAGGQTTLFNQPVNSVESAQLAPGGGLVGGQWKREEALPEARRSLALAAVERNLFVLGGCTYGSLACDYATDEVLVAKLGDGGALGEWSPTAALPYPLADHAAVAADGRIYVIGGREQGSRWEPSTRVLRAVPGEDGKIGAWVEVRPLPRPRFLAAAVAAEGRIFVVGGCESGGDTCDGDPSDTVFTAEILPGGGLGDWEEVAPLLDMPVGHGAVAVNGSLHIVGGMDLQGRGFDVTYWARINQEEGVLGSWARGPRLASTRTGHVALATAGRLLVVGGVPTALSNSPGSAWEAPLFEDGGIIHRVCRPASGACDAEEFCDGAGPECPDDAVAGPETTCRRAEGSCDVAETCDGESRDCPEDLLAEADQVCEEWGEQCWDPARCDGMNPWCPSPQPSEYGTECEWGICEEGTCYEP